MPFISSGSDQVGAFHYWRPIGDNGGIQTAGGSKAMN
jgi:hypothetical protein